jgi:hypothetical protein
MAVMSSGGDLFYILVEQELRAVDEAVHAAFWGNEDPGRVALSFTGKVEISTVFLSRPVYDRRSRRQLLFETSLFGPEGFLGVADRYGTWLEAKAGHRRIEEELRRSKPH